jgi:hypothetical protein
MHDLSISKAWEETKAFIARDGSLVTTVALALFVLPGVVFDVTMPEAPSGGFPEAGAWIGIAAIAVFVSLVGQLAVIRLAMGPHMTVGEAIRHGFRRVLPYVAAVLIWMLPFVLIGAGLYGVLTGSGEQGRGATALAALLLTLAVAFVAVRLSLVSAVAGAETAGPVAILGRSWRLTGGNWWRLFGFLLLFWIGALVLVAAVQSTFGVVARVLFDETGPLTLGALLVAIVTQLVSAIVSVGFFTMLARIYVQLAGRPEAQPSVPTTGT